LAVRLVFQFRLHKAKVNADANPTQARYGTKSTAATLLTRQKATIVAAIHRA
jgi:hypothetical protein